MRLRKWLFFSAALLFCVILSGSALTEGQNAVLWHADTESGDTGYVNTYITDMLVCESKGYGFFTGSEMQLLVFDPRSDTSEIMDMKDINSRYNTIPEDGSREEISLWFTWRDQIYALISTWHLTEEEGEAVPPEGGLIRRLSLDSGKPELVDTDLARLDWEPMIEGDESWYGIRSIRSSFCLGDTLFILSYDDSYNDLLLFYDLTSGRCEEQYMQNVSSIASGPEGKLLICRYIQEDEGGYELSLFDPSSASFESMARLPGTAGNIQALCYNAENNTLYYAASGELRAMPDLDFSRVLTVNDCPLDSNPTARLLPDGRILIYDYVTALLRTTDPALRQEITLRVTDYAYLPILDSAYFDFTAENGSVSLVIDRSGSGQDILQAMMNQDSTTDVYTLSMSSSVFNALFNRGYMASLSGSEKLTALVDSMYPAVSAAVRKDGDLTAVPLAASAYGLGFNPKVLEKVGLSESDLPRSWEAFFDFLRQLPARLEGSGVNAFPYWYTLSDIKTSLMFMIFSDCEASAAGNDRSIDFSSPILQSLLESLSNLDADALNIQTGGEEENGISYEWQEDAYLFDLNTPLTMGAYNTDYTAMLLSLDDGDPVSGYTVICAFVNPYSLHPSEAIAFLESAAGRIYKADLYTLSPENNEPLRSPDFAEYKEYLTQALKEGRESLEKEEDPTLRSAIEETLANLESNLASIDDTYWQISPGAIAAYQARAPYLIPAPWGMMDMIRETYDETMYELFKNFAEGNTSGRELLEQLNKKYQMMLQEGN